MSNGTQRAAIYARVSSEEQSRGYSISTQLEACRKYCADRGYVSVGEFTDAHTGTTMDRPGINALIDAQSELQPHVIVLYDVDRLGRETVVQAILEQDLTRGGARIEYVLGGETHTPEGELLKLVKSAIAVFENRQRVERGRRGKIGRVKAGYPMVSGRSPFGYTYVSEPHKGWLVVNEEEAAIVREMYHWLTVERVSSYEIAKRLWEKGIATRGDEQAFVFKKSAHAEWSPATVRKVLSSTTYKGQWAYGKKRRATRNGKVVWVAVPKEEWIFADVPAIVDEMTWVEAQRCLAENKANARRNARREYLLRGMVFCPCGRRWTGRYKNNRGLAYYRCPTTESEGWRSACPARFSMRQEILEMAVWNQVTAFLLDPDTLLSEVARQRNEQATETARRAQRLESVDAAIAGMDRKLGQLLTRELDGYPQAVIDREKEALISRRRDLETERSRRLVERAEQEISADLEAMLQELAETVRIALPAMTFEEKRRILELLRIRVDVIDRTHVQLSGIITGSIVNTTYWPGP